MTAAPLTLYAGEVVHRRVWPRVHALRYRVCAVLADVDRLAEADRELGLFSYNRANLFALRDADFGCAGGLPIATKVRDVLARHGLEEASARIRLLCYPRLLGYAFNPLSVYFCETASGRLGAVIYEVTNTFGSRKSYVVRIEGGEQATPHFHTARKALYVSPFNPADGDYSFHLVPPGDRLLVGVALRTEGRAVLTAHFRAERLEASDAALVRMAAAYPLMTLKVMAGIHWEALRLWRKGLRVVPRPSRSGFESHLDRDPQGEHRR